MSDSAARFQAVIGSEMPRLRAVAHRLCREPATAADLVQDTLERAWRHFDSLDDDGRVAPWLVRVMRNSWIDQVRRRRVEVPLDEAAEPPAEPAEASEEPAWARVTLEDLRGAIEQLHEPFRSVARLHDLDGCSYREVARRLEIPNATAASRLHRAHARIREMVRPAA
jgi:RNA polymerase sigma-70 factor (ECF subfamily)